MRLSRASAKEYFIQRAKIALNFATTKFLIFFEVRQVEREHELSEFLWGGVGRECEFYELGEFYEFFFKLDWGLRILGEWDQIIKKENSLNS